MHHIIKKVYDRLLIKIDLNNTSITEIKIVESDHLLKHIY